MTRRRPPATGCTLSRCGAPLGDEGLCFYLGTHETSWLRRTAIPLFVSRRRLVRLRRLPRATCRWACDSGGFTELSMHARWTVSAQDYARDVQRYRDEIGSLDWAAPQDWMCEPWIVARTGFSVAEHQRRTIASVQELRALGAAVVPVLQGWTIADYVRHVEDYDRAGIDLRAEPAVGVGSVCRRQGTEEGARIMRTLAVLGLRLHGFGFKSEGLRAAHDAMVSADSLAWSFRARRSPPLPGCAHKSCANCLRYALAWRERLIASLRPIQEQLELFLEVS